MQRFHRYDLLCAWYGEYLTINHFSSYTITDYKRELRMLRQFLEDETEVTDIDTLDKTVLRSYVATLYDKRLNARTIQRKVTVLRSVFQTFYNEYKLYINFATGLQVPRAGPRLPTAILTEKETETLFGYLDAITETTNDPKLLRDRLIVELLYGSGMRRGELHRLKVGDIQPTEGLIGIYGSKGGKDRMAPVGEKGICALQDYLERGRPKLASAHSFDFLLLNSRGGRLSSESISKTVSRVVRSAGIDKPIRAHDLRHSCATHMLNHGADIRYVQELLGHSSLKSTQVYTHVSIKKLQESHRKYHPREQAGFIGDGTNNQS